MAGLTRHERIRRRAEFQRIYAQGLKVSGRLATLFILPNSLSVARLGIAATRKLGSAVERNRAKRLVRETFRRNKPAPGVDVVVVPRRELLDSHLGIFEGEYRQSLERRFGRRGRPSGR